MEGAILGAATGAAISAIAGQDIGKGALTGALSGAAFGAVGGYLQAHGLEKVIQAKVGLHAAAGAVSGGINASITGGNVGMGMLTGGISGGAAAYGGTFLDGQDFPIQLAGRSFIGGVTGGIAAELYGGNFGQGFGQGAWTAGFGFLFNDQLNRGGNWFSRYFSSEGIKERIELGTERWKAELGLKDETAQNIRSYERPIKFGLGALSLLSGCADCGLYGVAVAGAGSVSGGTGALVVGVGTFPLVGSCFYHIYEGVSLMKDSVQNR